MGCRCASCELGAAARLVGDPLALALAGAHGGGIGDLLPRMPWASDVDREKARLDASFVATDVAARECTSLTAAERAGWSALYATWLAFRARETPTFGASNEWDLSQQYAADLAGWQATIRARCPVPGPKPTGSDNREQAGVDMSWVKWAAAAVIVGAGVYAVRSFV